MMRKITARHVTWFNPWINIYKLEIFLPTEFFVNPNGESQPIRDYFADGRSFCEP
jgi:hypothetical protein